MKFTYILDVIALNLGAVGILGYILIWYYFVNRPGHHDHPGPHDDKIYKKVWDLFGKFTTAPAAMALFLCSLIVAWVLQNAFGPVELIFIGSFFAPFCFFTLFYHPQEVWHERPWTRFKPSTLIEAEAAKKKAKEAREGRKIDTSRSTLPKPATHGIYTGPGDQDVDPVHTQGGDPAHGGGGHHHGPKPASEKLGYFIFLHLLFFIPVWWLVYYLLSKFWLW